MAVYDVQIRGVQTLQAALHGIAHPRGAVIKLGGADAPDLREEEVGRARVRGCDGGCGEGGTEEGFGGSVVGRGVEGSHALVERAGDDLRGGEREGVGVVLIVEGRGAAD